MRDMSAEEMRQTIGAGIVHMRRLLDTGVDSAGQPLDADARCIIGRVIAVAERAVAGKPIA